VPDRRNSTRQQACIWIDQPGDGLWVVLLQVFKGQVAAAAETAIVVGVQDRDILVALQSGEVWVVRAVVDDDAVDAAI